MRKNNILKSDIDFEYNLNENLNFSLVDRPDISALKGIKRFKTFDNLWNYHSKFVKDKYTRIKEKYLKGVYPFID